MKILSKPVGVCSTISASGTGARSAIVTTISSFGIITAFRAKTTDKHI
jgi:hypothetical protein